MAGDVRKFRKFIRFMYGFSLIEQPTLHIVPSTFVRLLTGLMPAIGYVFCNASRECCWPFFMLHDTLWLRIKLSAQGNETETRQFQNSFETVFFQCHFFVRAV